MKIKNMGQKSATAITLLAVSMFSPMMLSANGYTRTSQVSHRSQKGVTKVIRNTTSQKVSVNRSCAKVSAPNNTGENVEYRLNVRSRPFGPVVQQLEHDKK